MVLTIVENCFPKGLNVLSLDFVNGLFQQMNTMCRRAQSTNDIVTQTSFITALQPTGFTPFHIRTINAKLDRTSFQKYPPWRAEITFTNVLRSV